ncbi:MAG: UPF0182 family protein [Nitriliruptorales bacterium]
MRDLLRRRLGLVVAVVVVVLLLSATRLAGLFTDLWWFDDLGYRDVFTTVLLAQLGLAVAFGLALAVLIGANLFIARRLRPFFMPRNEREAIIERYRQMVDPYVPLIIVGVSLVFAFSAGGAVATQWDRYLLWSNGGDFAIADPQFNRDVGFYVFDLPWLSFVQGWLFTSLVLTLIITAIAHYLFGSIRPELPRDRVTPRAKAHLSVLLALVLAARGWGYWLDRFRLNFSPRGTVTGASYTDVHAELPALHLLLVVTAVAIVLVLWNIRSRGWLLPGAAIGLLILASILLQGIYPAAIQRLRVDPQELAREREFIERNLEATRHAYGIGEVESTRFTVEDDLGDEDVDEHQVTLNNVRLWDPPTLITTYKQLQAIRPYYEFADVDVDRYVIDGELRQVMVSTREMFSQGLESSAQTWQNLHLTFTHGYGVVASQVNTATSQGQPVFLARGIPPRGEAENLVPDEPGLYFGEDHDDYSIVRTGQDELDFEDSDTGEQVTTSYDGEGGVPVGTMLRRLAFALRMRDANLVLSDLIHDGSEIIFRRLVPERVQTVAPYLTLDGDPYPVVIDRRIVWVQDAYTTSADYPYSERSLFKGTTVNYVRNSVKAVVDGYHGTVTLYVVDPDDPVLQAWQQIFPESFASLSEAPEQLREHFRYPQDLFELQTMIYQTYHIPGPDAFYSKADAWERPPDAAAIANLPEGSTELPLLEPYYLLMRLPGEGTEEFVLIQPYLARNKPNMIAWLAGRSDPGHFGKLSAVQFPSDQTILGPAQAQARIEQDPTISEYITLRSQAGSEVRRGNLLVIPIERSILYVEPLFIENPQARIPELAQVTVVMGDRVVMAQTLPQALEALLGEAPPAAGPVGDEEDQEEDEFDEDAVLREIVELFRQADEALRNGDLAGYQRAIERAQALIERVIEERGVFTPEPEEEQEAAPGEEPSPAPSPTG